MSWPFDKKEITNMPDPTNANPDKLPEKSMAEQIADSLKPFGDTLSRINERLDSFEQRVITKPEPQTEGERPAPTSVLEDENVAFAQRLTPIMLRQLELEARIIRNDIRSEYSRDGYGELWEQYEKEINTVLEGSPLVTADGKTLRGDPSYIRNVVDMVFGREARKAGMKFGGKDRGFFLESAGSGTENLGERSQNDGLTDGQRKVFGRMKVSTEDAKKVMAKLKFVS